MALWFGTGVPLTAAMLAVLKTGRFFVPLDATMPKARVEAILDDCQTELLLGNRTNLLSTSDLGRKNLEQIDYDCVDENLPSENLGLAISSQALALLIYTSGSTGQPKGVLQNQQSVLHRVMLQTNGYHLCQHDRFSLLTSGTSNAVMYIFLTLLSGAALLPFNVQKRGALSLARWLAQEKISVCPISAPLFRNLGNTLQGKQNFPDLRLIRLTSEAAYKTEFDIYKNYFSANCVLINILSATETGPLRLLFIDRESSPTTDEVNVGYAVEDKEILIVDPAGKELGFNEVGEIAVRSDYLTPGYWRRPDLTKSKFVPNPRNREETIYLTGDLGQMRPDGCLVYQGRKDFRIKIRGYSVELAEIEKTLLQYAGIKEALLTSQQNTSGEASLIAYFVPATQPGPTVSMLQNFLKQKLPEHMIPSFFLKLNALPLTTTGKIDRHRLPRVGTARPNLDTPFVAPRTSSEEQLARIWSEVLSVDSVGIHDSFFDLGGHSLSATRIVSRLLQQFRFELPLRSLFQSPTIAEMAVVIDRPAGHVYTA